MSNNNQLSTQSMSSNQLMSSTENYNRMVQFAEQMATANVTVPDHLRGNVGDCMAIAMQSLQWGMNPFVVAQKTSTVAGKLTYEGQLVSAVLTNSGVLKDRPKYEYFGDWSKVLGKHKMKTSSKGNQYAVPGWTPKDEEGLGVTVTATMKGEDEPRSIDVYMAQAVTRNSTIWATDPQQQLSYFAIRVWARRNAPDTLLGVYTPDEIDPQPLERELNPTQQEARSASKSVDPNQAHQAITGTVQRDDEKLNDDDIKFGKDDSEEWQPSKKASALADHFANCGDVDSLQKVGAQIQPALSKGEIDKQDTEWLRGIYKTMQEQL